MQTPRKHSAIAPTLIAATVSACFPALVHALPVGPNVTSGTANFSQNGNTLTVTNSNQAIINWQSFSTGSGETVRFIQPSAASSVLNRVTSSDPSILLGMLQSNGKVFLINPAGILVGQGARIDVAGFVASTLNLSDSDFLAKRLRFTEVAGAGSVKNAGEISSVSGGSVYLVAPQVENSGIIRAPNGEVLLAAGQKIELHDTASPGVVVEVIGSEGSATNLGTITAEAGRIGIAGVLVKNSGTLNASSLVSEGGRVFLKAKADTIVDGDARISATGSKGGQIEILGDRVSLQGNARLDASGNTGGGAVLVGGDYQGKNSAIQNAQTTDIGADVTIKADALDQGNGGKVIVWADGTTTARGNISARGGATGGDGGFVEVSGKHQLFYRGFTDTRAPMGQTGTLLLDPDDITINPGAGTDDLVSANGTVYGNNITTGLAASNMVFQTGTGGSGNITFTSGAYNFSGAGTTNSLTILARSLGVGGSTGHISLPTGANITMAPGATIKLVAGWDGVSTANPATIAYTSGYGNLNMTGTASIDSGGGLIKLLASADLNATNLSGGGSLYASAGGVMTMNSSNLIDNVTLSGGSSISYHTGLTGVTHINNATATGPITITGDAGSGKIGIGTINTGAANVTVNAQSSILDDNGSGVTNITAGSTVLTSANGAASGSEIAISADVNGTGSLSATASGLYGGMRLYWMNAGTAPSTLSLTDSTTAAAQGQIDYSSAGNISTGGFTFSSANGGITLSTPGNITYGTATLNLGSGAPLVFNAGGNLTFSNSLNISNPLVLHAGGTLTANGTAIVATDNIDIATGSLDLNSASIQSNGGSVLVNATGAVNLSNSSTVTASSGDVVMHAGSINLNASMMNAANDINLTALGDIHLDNGASVHGSNDVFLKLTGASSTLYLNESTGQPPCNVTAGSAINLAFLGRNVDGIIIDGVPTAATTTGGSGFFNSMTESAALLGTNLFITYAPVAISNPATSSLISNPVTSSLNSSLISSTVTSSLISSLSSTSSSTSLGLSEPPPSPSPTTNTLAATFESMTTGSSDQGSNSFGSSGTSSSSTKETTKETKQEVTKDTKSEEKKDAKKETKKLAVCK